MEVKLNKTTFINYYTSLYEEYCEQKRIIINISSEVEKLFYLEKINFNYYESVNILRLQIDSNILIEILEDADLINRIMVLNYIKDSFLLIKDNASNKSLLKKIIYLYVDGTEEEIVITSRIISPSFISMHNIFLKKLCSKYISGDIDFDLNYYTYHQLYYLVQKIGCKNLEKYLIELGKNNINNSVKEAFEELFIT